MQNEGTLRDALAANLDLIEEGLRLVRTEYPVENPDGASAKIDILAKDRLGVLVVIELKRSSSTSRTALHELMKYLALLQAQKGIRGERLRAILVSTDWRELLVPFSELCHTSPFSLAGCTLRLDAAGLPSSTTPVAILPKSDGLRFPTRTSWLTFAASEDRDRVEAAIAGILATLELAHALVLRVSARAPGSLQFPFGLVLVLFEIDEAEAIRLLSQTRYPIHLLDDLGPPEPHELGDFVKQSLEAQLFNLEGVGEVDEVDHEEFLANIPRWEVERILRHGRVFADAVLFTDDQIVRSLAGSDTGTDVRYYGAASPANKMQWAAFVVRVLALAERRGQWAEAIRRELDEAERDRTATVVASIFSPANLLRHLALFARTGNVGWLPSFELLVVRSDGSAPRSLRGATCWNGVTEAPPAELLGEVVGVSIPLAFVVEDAERDERIGQIVGLAFPVHDGAGEWDEPAASVVAWRERFADVMLPIARMMFVPDER